MRILIRTSYLIIITYLLISRLILVIFTYFVIKYMFERTRNMSLIKKESSKNIFAKIKAKMPIQNRPIVILSAHYDSISANISYRIQMIIFFIYKLIILFYCIIIVVLSSLLTLDLLDLYKLPQNIFIIIAILSLSGIVISIPILYLVFNEKPSANSIDNASGVAILIELAKLFKKNPLNNMDLLFIWPGAEEWGMKGSKKFCEGHFIDLNQKYELNNSININIDMVGTYIGLLNRVGLIRRNKLNNRINNIFISTANDLKIPIKIYNKIIEPKSDHKAFRKCAKKFQKKLQIVYFHSDKDTKYIHSLRDTPDKCSVENLNGCLKTCYHTLKRIDIELD
ncbi:MAG: M28 family metallopeptidase [Promethearchaeota archaeon]